MNNNPVLEEDKDWPMTNEQVWFLNMDMNCDEEPDPEIASKYRNMKGPEDLEDFRKVFMVSDFYKSLFK